MEADQLLLFVLLLMRSQTHWEGRERNDDLLLLILINVLSLRVLVGADHAAV